MEIGVGTWRGEAAPGDVVEFGRAPEGDLPVVVEPPDASVSRRAGELRFVSGSWRLTNVGRRSFFLVEAGVEIELHPEGVGRNQARLLHPDAWIRVPMAEVDAAIVCEVPPDERPSATLAHAPTSGDLRRTEVEGSVELTDNELMSVLAIYENYLHLPPRYRREPNSFRAAARRLRVEEGKVKADLRRVQKKVERAGGLSDGGSRYRDALIEWLLSRGVVRRDQVDRLG